MLAVMYRLKMKITSLSILVCWLLWPSVLSAQQDVGTGVSVKKERKVTPSGIITGVSRPRGSQSVRVSECRAYSAG